MKKHYFFLYFFVSLCSTYLIAFFFADSLVRKIGLMYIFLQLPPPSRVSWTIINKIFIARFSRGVRLMTHARVRARIPFFIQMKIQLKIHDRHLHSLQSTHTRLLNAISLFLRIRFQMLLLSNTDYLSDILRTYTLLHLRSVLRSTFAYTHGTWFNLRISCNLMRIYTSKDKIYILHFIPPS